MAYDIEFAESVKEHLRHLTVRQRDIVLDGIEEQLQYEPLVETGKRRLMRANPVAPWELRLGNLRAFYEVPADEPNVVRVLAVGYKEGNRLFIAGKEVKL